MLTRYQLTLLPDRPCRPKPEWGYCLYAALLKMAPEEFGSTVHRDTVTPISQFLACNDQSLIWTVNLLGEASEQSLGEVLEHAEIFELVQDKVHLRVAERTCQRIPDVETLLTLAECHSGVHHLQFRTATAFKSRGQYLNLPTTRLIVQNLMNKWNGCILECPIEDEDGQGMEALAAGLRCRDFRLQNRIYRLKGQAISGFVGSITLENHLSGFHRQLANALLIFAGYAGIGIKTTLGMGGVSQN